MRVRERRPGAVGARALLALAGWAAPVGLGCLEEVEVDEGERAVSSPPTAEFDPAAGVIPFPSNLLLNQETGRLALPPSCGEDPDGAQAVLRASLNQLDGFATLGTTLRLPFSEPVALESAEGRLLLVRLAERGQPLAAPEPPVELRLLPSARALFDAACQPAGEAFELVAIAEAPLAEDSTYALFVLAGILSESGEPFAPSVTWSLVRQTESPVEVVAGPGGEPLVVHHRTPFDPRDEAGQASLLGLSQLWQAHAPALQAFDALGSALSLSPQGREELLVATAFNTQSWTTVFDPAAEGSPASQFAESGAVRMAPAVAGAGAPLSVAELYASALPGTGCEALGCEAIGSVHTALGAAPGPNFSALSFRSGDDCDSATDELAGAWPDPLRPSAACEASLPLLVVVPATPPDAAGYPTVLFAHGLGRSKEDLLIVAGRLAQAGFASVAMDAVRHGSRAVRVSTAAELGCAAAGPGLPCEQTLSPTCAPQCYAPLLSGDLTATRDGLRQTVVDQLQLEGALRRCAQPEACGPLHVDPDRIGFLGHSLGSLLGGVTLPMSGMRAGVLSTGGGGWVDILVNTENDPIRCSLVDGLIAAGVLQGTPWGAARDPEALCLTADWAAQPGFVTFAAAARWLLEPADGLSYASALRTGSSAVLLGEIRADAIIPNTATAALGTLWGLTPTAVGPSTSPLEATPEASLPGSLWLQYSDQPANPGSGFPGNAYGHGSLLQPAAPGAEASAGAGELGTARVQSDALSFLRSHL